MSKGGEPFFQAECETQAVCFFFCTVKVCGDFIGSHKPVIILFEQLDEFFLCV